MKLFLLPNRLLRPASSLRILVKPTISLPSHARRHASDKRDNDKSKSHELLEEYYKSNPDKYRKMASGEETYQIEEGKLAEDSVFETWKEQEKPAETAEEDMTPSPEDELYKRDPEYLKAALDPAPQKRWKWEREQIIKAARRGWVITKEQHLRRTERQCKETSPWLKTSIKKLNMLGRQIAGKSVDEALLQLRFSKRRVALEVAKHLEYARDRAIAKWGMSLGQVNGTVGKQMRIQLKDGTDKLVSDKTSLYIAQAFVSRGPYRKEVEFRARGNVNLLRRPYTSITFLLKEEATRVREHEERKEKALRKKPFIPLPDRPIVQQRQYVLW